MAKRLFILLIFAEIIPLVPSVFRKYYPIKQLKTWTQARDYCRATYTDLASLESDAHMAQLIYESKLKGFTSYAWIGLYNDINSWRWSLEDETLGSFRWWYSSYPNNRHGNDECIYTTASGWVDDQCLLRRPFVCFDANMKGTSRYIYYSTSKTWYEAQRFCRQNHTDLTSVRDATERSTVLGKIPSYAWIGLFRDSWKWSDNTTLNVSSSEWIPSSSETSTCAYIYAPTGRIISYSCTYTRPFICYKLGTGRRQIIKIKVQSVLDVNHPAVKAEILEQLQQKLEEHGMTNFTVQLKEHPKGKVFHQLNYCKEKEQEEG